MNKIFKFIVGCLVLAAIGVGIDLSCYRKRDIGMMNWIQKSSDIPSLFPNTAAQLDKRVIAAMNKATQEINAIVSLPAYERTYENTMQPFDELCGTSDLCIMAAIVEVLKYVSPDEAVRNAAGTALVTIKEFMVKHISNNPDLYRSINDFAQNNDLNELDEERRYFISETLADFKREGLDLPAEKREKIVTLKQEITQLCEQFETNIASDLRTITATIDDLQGLNQDFIDNLKRDKSGTYLLGMDYPTIQEVLSVCTVEDTRKRLSFEFNNRAYPINEEILKNIIAKRDELARALGFASFAALNLDNSMVKNVDTAQAFLDELIAKSTIKETQEFNDLISDLPENVSLIKGKLGNWNYQYVKDSYKKKHYSLDEIEISHYFPMERTIQGLLDIYRQFLSIEFQEEPISNMWHEDVRLIAVYTADKSKLIGYLLLDMFPRPHKYTHACEIGIVPSVQSTDGKDRPGLALVICNFTKPTATKPSLLSRNFVSTFFHEFGHALHQLLGRTEIASMSGTSVKRDFVEMPSQMLEEWLWDKTILKNLSYNYLTHKQMPDEMIDAIIETKNIDSGYFVLRQAAQSQLALDYYKPGAIKDPFTIMKTLMEKICPHYAMLPDTHFYTSFGHLTGYGAQYYGYMWSKVFALDLFYEIKKHGLLNPAIGKRYVADILVPGGTKDPNILLENFLGRPSNQEAFFKDLGL